MHPPLIYCPHSTQFKFHIVDEKQCFLHPHHGPFPRVRDDSKDTATSAEPTGQTVSQPPVTGDNAAREVGDVREGSSVEPTKRRASFQELNMKDIHATWGERPDKQGSYHGIETVATSVLPDAYSQRPSPLAQNQRIVSLTYDHPQGRAASSSNWRSGGDYELRYGTNIKSTRDIKPQGSYRPSSGNEYHAKALFGARQQALSDPPYQYLPYQAAKAPHLQGASGRTPPMYDYCMALYNDNQQQQYQAGALPPPSFPLAPNPVYTEYVYGSNTRAIPSHQDGIQALSFNPEATAFDIRAQKNAAPLDEQHQQTLEQLRLANDAAYNCNNHGKSLSVSGTSDDNANRASRAWKSRSPPPAGELSEENAHDATGQTGDDVPPRPRSWSESYPRLPSISIASSPVTQKVRSPTTNEQRENMRGSYASCAAATPLPVSTAQTQSTAVSAGSSDDKNRNTGKEVDEHLPDGQEIDQRPKFLCSDDVEDALEAGRNPLKLDSPSLQALTTTDEDVKSESSHTDNAPVQAECDVSIKQESDDEDCKLEGIPEWASSNVETGTEIEIKDDSHSEVDLPQVPPNSPVDCADDIDKRADTVEREGPSIPRDEAAFPKLPAAPKTYTFDAPDTAAVPAQAHGLSVGVPVQRSWSAVVSGSYVPSEASRPRPSRAVTPAPVPSPRPVVPATTSEPKPAKPAVPLNNSTSFPSITTTAGAKQPSDTSNAPSRNEAPTKTWASLLHGTPDAPTSKKPQQSTKPELSEPKPVSNDPKPRRDPPPPPPNSPSDPASPSAAHQEMLNSIWEHKFPPSDSQPNTDTTAAAAATSASTSSSTTLKGPDSASIVSDDSVAATEATSSARSAQSAAPVQPSRVDTTPAAPDVEQRPAPPQKPRLWSQLVGGGGSSRLAPFKNRSESRPESSNGMAGADTQWPSLGSNNNTTRAAERERKRNSSS